MGLIFNRKSDSAPGKKASAPDDTSVSRDFVAVHQYQGRRYAFVVEGAVFDTHLGPLAALFYDKNYPLWLSMVAKIEEKIGRGDPQPITISVHDFG